MQRDYLNKDTIQIKRMKKHLLLWIYSCSGEVYKLLSLEVLHRLIKKIKKGTIKLNSKLLYEKNEITLEENEITLEENLISILDKYIGYVRDTYTINHNELLIILEQTLKNNYNKELFVVADFHECPKIFLNGFKKMFLANLVYNTRYYAKQDTNNIYHSLQKANLFLESKSLSNSKDIKEIEKFYIKVISNRKSNLYNIFLPHSEIDKKQLPFYFHQVDWIYDDYYKKYDSIFEG